MSVRSTAAASHTEPSIEAGLLARLGLPSTASAQQVETAHDGLVGFLETAPADLQAWVAREIDRIDEAYALLSDPTIDRSAAASPVTAATSSTIDRGRATSSTKASAPIGTEDDLDPLDDDPERNRTRGRSRRGPHVDDARTVPATPPKPGVRRLRRVAIIAAAVVGVAAIAVIGFNMGSTTGVPGVAGSPEPAAASPAIDTAKVGDLMQKIQADPKDIASLQALADIYYAGNRFDTAAGFLRKIIAIDAGNVTARLALGAAMFNIGQPTEAEAQWREVLRTDPNNLEAHYDLGFMYLSRDPADLANAKVEWSKVIAIAPDSDVAKSVQQHLSSLDGSPAPGSSGASASSAPAGTAAATAVPSAVPSAAPSAAGAPTPSGR